MNASKVQKNLLWTRYQFGRKWEASVQWSSEYNGYCNGTWHQISGCKIGAGLKDIYCICVVLFGRNLS